MHFNTKYRCTTQCTTLHFQHQISVHNSAFSTQNIASICIFNTKYQLCIFNTKYQCTNLHF
ncbi:hypothetical protein Patl1_11075 [Pistacia atlantica]|uniref:Uncharacterized protein n=1 Tax=Pistacia atlantica TaxID=434234 RepID=A0ACC1A5D9_9ROSI|nr:hypothetical protein Patl1_11075 [Pistacia atlantica]